MKWLILLIPIIFLSCSILDPEEQEKTFTCYWMYGIAKSTGTVSAPRAIKPYSTLNINGQTYTCVICDWVKVTAKGDDIIRYEYYRNGNHYLYEADSNYKYYWRKK